MTACSASRPSLRHESAGIQLYDVVTDGDEIFIDIAYDPWEGYNLWMYNFNAKFDRYLFIPTTNTYKFVVPSFARVSIYNFFSNLSEVGNIANSILQAKPTQFKLTLGRFLVNSSIGIFGLMDPATKMGLAYEKEDLGQTLATWGIGPGPYVMLPIFGPSTLRDAPSVFINRIFHPIYDPEPWLTDMKSEEQLTINVVDAINKRTNISFRYYEMGTPFEYYWIRSLWLEHRKLEISK